MLLARWVWLFLLLLFPYLLLLLLFIKFHVCVHDFQCDCSIITVFCFAFDCCLKVLFGLNDLICSINEGVVNSVVTIELSI